MVPPRAYAGAKDGSSSSAVCIASLTAGKRESERSTPLVCPQRPALVPYQNRAAALLGARLWLRLQRGNVTWAGEAATVDAMKQLTVAALGLWLGAMGFFAFVVAPAAFSTLDREAAGRFVSAVFPKYYAVGFGLGLVALASLVVRVLGRGVRPLDWVPIGLLVLMLTLPLFAGAVALPAA